MELTAGVFPLILVLLAVNQVVPRALPIARFPAVVWIVNLANVAVAAYALFKGLPGFEQIRPASWMVGLVFLMHGAKNLQALTDARLAAREERLLAEELAERERLLAEEERPGDP